MSTYSKEFKEEAMHLSDEIGVKKAAAQLGIPYNTLSDWRNHSKHMIKQTTTMSEDELHITTDMIKDKIVPTENICIQGKPLNIPS